MPARRQSIRDLQIVKNLPKDARSVPASSDEKDVISLRSIISQVVKAASDRFSGGSAGASSEGGTALSRSLTEAKVGLADAVVGRVQPRDAAH